MCNTVPAKGKSISLLPHVFLDSREPDDGVELAQHTVDRLAGSRRVGLGEVRLRQAGVKNIERLSLD